MISEPNQQDSMMNFNSNSNTAGRETDDRRDRGAVLSFVLIFFSVIGIVLVASLTFTSTVLQNRPPIHERNARVEAVRSAMRMAIQFQRDRGVGDCFQNTSTYTFNAGTPEEVDATVNCSIGAVEDLPNNYFREGGDAFALVTTNRDPAVAPVSGASLPLAGPVEPYKLIEGNVFLAGGDMGNPLVDDEAGGRDILFGNETGGSPGTVVLGDTDGLSYTNESDLAVDCNDSELRQYMPQTAIASNGESHSNNLQCQSGVSWVDRVGTRVGAATAWSYPDLPNIPANRRPAFVPRAFGTDEDGRNCYVVFPGRYDEQMNFDIPDATYYLPSGIFYLTEPMTVSNGAKVVAGQGRVAGCEVDSTVLLDQNTKDVESSAITGRGATFLLDGNGSITVDEAQLYINRRISTPSTRGSEGIAVRAVQTVTSNDPALFVPADQVVTGVDSDGNRILEPASTYETTNDLGQTVSYQGSNAAPDGSDTLIDVNFDSGATSQTPAFVADGNVFIPQGGFALAASDASYQFIVDGGMVAANVALDVTAVPSDLDNNWFLGVDASPLLRRVQLEATATVGGKTARSVALFQVNSVGNYAINSWVVDPNGSSGGWVPNGGSDGGTSTGGTTTGGTTTGGTSTGGSTDGGTATGGSATAGGGTTDGGTTDGGTTDGGTTDGGTTDGGTTDGGTTDGGTTDGGTTDGGTTDGGTTDGGTTDGGTTDGGTTDGGTTDGGTTDGGTTDGGTTDGGTTDGGSTDGGSTDGGSGPAWGTCDDPTKWSGVYFDNVDLLGDPALGQCEDDIDFNWDRDPGPNGLEDEFSARWTKSVDFAEAGEYTFTIGGDDGVRLKVDGGVVYSKWEEKSYSTEEHVMVLTAGTHVLELEYYENTGEAQVSLDWEYTEPAPDPCLPDETWTGEYFDNTSLSGDPDLVRQDAIPYIEAGTTVPVGADKNDFSIRWTKKILFNDADYDFTVGGNDGFRLFIDGSEVIEDWTDGAYRTDSVRRTMSSDCAVPVVMEFYQGGGTSHATYDHTEVQACAPDDDLWYARYYNGTSLSNFQFEQFDDSPNFNWGNGSPNRDDLGNNTYSIKWTKTFNFPSPGEYRFTVGSDDGTRLYVDGTRVINNWNNQSYNQGIRTTTVDIEDHCQVQLEMHYYEKNGSARVSYEWERIGDL